MDDTGVLQGGYIFSTGKLKGCCRVGQGVLQKSKEVLQGC